MDLDAILECLLDDAYVYRLLDQLKKVNHASVTSGVVRIPHVPYIHLPSCLFDTGSITNKSDGGNMEIFQVPNNNDVTCKHLANSDTRHRKGKG